MRSDLFLAASICLAACSKAEAPSLSADAGVTDASVFDAGELDSANVNLYPDAGACVVDGGPGIPCPQSVSSYCSADAAADGDWACGTTWQALQASPPCLAGAGCPFSAVSYESCGDTQAIFRTSIDTASGALFDRQTGELVAIVGIEDPGVRVCVAGPACIPVPTCTVGEGVDCCPVDAGGE